MTLDQVGALLKVLAAYDGRNVGEADLMVWGRQMADLDPADAAEAIHQHYGDGGEWAKPSHIRTRAEKIRNARNRRPEVVAPGCYEPDPLERRRLGASEGGPLALPGRLEDDAARAARMKEGAAKVREVIGPMVARMSLGSERTWQRKPAAGGGGAWWEDDDQRERHARELLAGQKRLHICNDRCTCDRDGSAA